MAVDDGIIDLNGDVDNVASNVNSDNKGVALQATPDGTFASLTSNAKEKLASYKAVKNIPISEIGVLYSPSKNSFDTDYTADLYKNIKPLNHNAPVTFTIGSAREFTYNGETFVTYVNTLSGTDYELYKDYPKFIRINTKYPKSETGTLVFTGDAQVLVGGSIKNTPTDSLTGIIINMPVTPLKEGETVEVREIEQNTPDTFYVTFKKGQDARVIIDILLTTTVPPTTGEYTTIYALGDITQAETMYTGNVVPVTNTDASDCDWKLLGNLGNDSSVFVVQQTARYYQEEAVTKYTFDQNVISGSNFTGFATNTRAGEEHASSTVFAMGKWTPAGVTGAKPFYADIVLSEGLKLGGINGYQQPVEEGCLEFAVSVTSANVASITMGQYKPNGTDPATAVTLNLKDHYSLASIEWVDPKDAGDVGLGQSIFNDGSSDRTMRFDLSSSNLTAQQILELDSTKIKKLSFNVTSKNINMATTTPEAPIEGGKLNKVARYQLDFVKSAGATTPPTITITATGGAFSSYQIAVSSVNTTTDYTTATHLVAKLNINGLFAGELVRMRDETGYRDGIKFMYFGVPNENTSYELFDAKGSPNDIISVVIPNVTYTRLFTLTTFTKETVETPQFPVMFSDNNTGLGVNVGCTREITGTSKLASIASVVTVPDSLPMTNCSYTVATAGATINDTVVTSQDLGAVCSVNPSSGWTSADKKNIYSVVFSNPIRTNMLSLIMCKPDNSKIRSYTTNTPASPITDPNGFFEVSWLNDTNEMFVRISTSAGMPNGYFNTHTIEPIVESAGSFYPSACLIIDSADGTNNTAKIKFFNTDGTAFSIDQVSAFSLYSTELANDIPYDDATLKVLSETGIVLDITADKVVDPVIVQNTAGTADGINIMLDSAYIPALWNGNLVTDNESRYQIRFKITGTKVADGASTYFLIPDKTVDPATGTDLDNKYYPIAGIPNSQYACIDVFDGQTDPVYIYAMVSNLTSLVGYTIYKVKQQIDIVPTDIVGTKRFSIIVVRAGTLGTKYYNCVAGTAPNIVENITNFGGADSSYTVQTANIGGINRCRQCGDVGTLEDTRGYKLGNSYYTTKPERDELGNMYEDIAGIFFVVHSESPDGVVVSSNLYTTKTGKKITATVADKVITLTENSADVVLSRPNVKVQVIQKPFASIPAGVSTFTSSDVDLANTSSTAITISVNTGVTPIADLIGGYVIETTQFGDADAITRPTKLAIAGEDPDGVYEVVFTQSDLGTPTCTLTRKSPMSVMDVKTPSRVNAIYNILERENIQVISEEGRKIVTIEDIRSIKDSLSYEGVEQLKEIISAEVSAFKQTFSDFVERTNTLKDLAIELIIEYVNPNILKTVYSILKNVLVGEDLSGVTSIVDLFVEGFIDKISSSISDSDLALVLNALCRHSHQIVATQNPSFLMNFKATAGNFPCELTIGTAPDFYLIDVAGTVPAETTDYTASPNKVACYKVNVAWKGYVDETNTGWKLKGTNVFSFGCIEKTTIAGGDGLLAVDIGTFGCATRVFGSLPIDSEFYISIQNQTQTTDFFLNIYIPEGFYVDPETSAKVYTKDNSLACDDAGVKKTVGWVNPSEVDGTYYYTEYNTMNNLSSDSGRGSATDGSGWKYTGKIEGSVTRYTNVYILDSTGSLLYTENRKTFAVKHTADFKVRESDPTMVDPTNATIKIIDEVEWNLSELNDTIATLTDRIEKTKSKCAEFNKRAEIQKQVLEDINNLTRTGNSKDAKTTANTVSSAWHADLVDEYNEAIKLDDEREEAKTKIKFNEEKISNLKNLKYLETGKISEFKAFEEINKLETDNKVLDQRITDITATLEDVKRVLATKKAKVDEAIKIFGGITSKSQKTALLSSLSKIRNELATIVTTSTKQANLLSDLQYRLDELIRFKSTAVLQNDGVTLRGIIRERIATEKLVKHNRESYSLKESIDKNTTEQYLLATANSWTKTCARRFAVLRDSLFGLHAPTDSDRKYYRDPVVRNAVASEGLRETKAELGLLLVEASAFVDKKKADDAINKLVLAKQVETSTEKDIEKMELAVQEVLGDDVNLLLQIDELPQLRFRIQALDMLKTGTDKEEIKAYIKQSKDNHTVMMSIYDGFWHIFFKGGLFFGNPVIKESLNKTEDLPAIELLRIAYKWTENQECRIVKKLRSIILRSPNGYTGNHMVYKFLFDIFHLLERAKTKEEKMALLIAEYSCSCGECSKVFFAMSPYIERSAILQFIVDLSDKGFAKGHLSRLYPLANYDVGFSVEFSANLGLYESFFMQVLTIMMYGSEKYDRYTPLPVIELLTERLKSALIELPNPDNSINTTNNKKKGRR